MKMKKYECILYSGTIGIYTGIKKPVEGQIIIVYVGNGLFEEGKLYDIIK